MYKFFSSKYSLYIYEGTIKELAAIQEKKDKNKRFLPLISKMLKLYGFKIIKSQKDYIDAQIIENMDKRIIVATNDKNLRHKIKRLGSRVLYLRQKNYLDLMKSKIDSDAGKEKYARRMWTIEPVFGNITSNKGINKLTLRGQAKVTCQWMMCCLVHNVEKLWRYGDFA